MHRYITKKIRVLSYTQYMFLLAYKNILIEQERFHHNFMLEMGFQMLFLNLQQTKKLFKNKEAFEKHEQTTTSQMPKFTQPSISHRSVSKIHQVPFNSKRYDLMMETYFQFTTSGFL